MTSYAVFYAVPISKSNGLEHKRAIRATAYRTGIPTTKAPSAQQIHENSDVDQLSSDATHSRLVDNLQPLQADTGARENAGVKHPPPKTASAEPEEKPTAGFPHDNDLIHLLVKDIRDAQYVTDIRNLRGLYKEFLMDQPRLVVEMLYRLPKLQTVEAYSRAVVQQEEAQELLEIISEQSFKDPRILCRSLASVAKVHAVPPNHMLDAVHAALRDGLHNFSVHNTVGQSGLLTCLAHLYHGSSRFDGDLDTALQRVLELQNAQEMTARQHSTVLWALARIGFQSSTVEIIISNCCTAIAQEANLELREQSQRSTTSIQETERTELQTEWQEEQALIKAAGFDLSWLPGGAPEHFVMLQAPLNARLAAGRFIDMDVALTSSSDLLEGSVKDSSAGSSTPPQALDVGGGEGSVSAAGRESEVQLQADSLPVASESEQVAVVAGEQRRSTNELGRSSTDADVQSQSGYRDTRSNGTGPHAEGNSSSASRGELLHPQSQDQKQQVEQLLAKKGNKPSQRKRTVRRGTFVEKHGQQTLSNTVWALATFETEEELDGVQDAIVACCQLFCAMNPQEVYLQVAANMAWASNHHGMHKASVLHQTVACVNLMGGNRIIKPQSVSNILYAMAEARYRDDRSLRILFAWAAQHVQRFNDQERANIAWSCARLNFSNRELFKALRPHVFDYVAKSEAWLKEVHHTALPKQRVSSMCAVLGQFLWSHSLLGHVNADIFQSICRPLALLEQIRKKSVAEAPVSHCSPPSAKYLNTRATGTLGYLGETILTQVATAWMCLEVLGDLPDAQPEAAKDGDEDGSRELVEHALAAMRREAHKTASSHSAVHDSICEVLQVLGASYERNVLLENELLCIQTLVRHAGADPVAIIPNRGHDLTITRPLEVVGNAAWHATQLRARGVRVAEVNGDSWRHLSRRERAAHLQHLLAPFAVH